MVLCLWELLELFEDYCWTVTSEISCSIFPLLDVSLFFSFFKNSDLFLDVLHFDYDSSRLLLPDQALKDHQERTSKDVVHEVIQKICRSTVWKKNMLFQKRTCTLFHKLSQNLTIMFILHSCTTTMTPQGFYSKSLLHAMHFAWEKFLWGKQRITEIYLLRFLDISWKYSSFY